jgi:hypothetical protein
MQLKKRSTTVGIYGRGLRALRSPSGEAGALAVRSGLVAPPVGFQKTAQTQPTIGDGAQRLGAGRWQSG